MFNDREFIQISEEEMCIFDTMFIDSIGLREHILCDGSLVSFFSRLGLKYSDELGELCVTLEKALQQLQEIYMGKIDGPINCKRVSCIILLLSVLNITAYCRCKLICALIYCRDRFKCYNDSKTLIEYIECKRVTPLLPLPFIFTKDKSSSLALIFKKMRLTSDDILKYS